MKPSTWFHRRSAPVVAIVMVSAAAGCDRPDPRGGLEVDAFGPTLLPEVRRAALMVPGELPRSLGVISVSTFERSAATAASRWANSVAQRASSGCCCTCPVMLSMGGKATSTRLRSPSTLVNVAPLMSVQVAP